MPTFRTTDDDISDLPTPPAPHAVYWVEGACWVDHPACVEPRPGDVLLDSDARRIVTFHDGSCWQVSSALTPPPVLDPSDDLIGWAWEPVYDASHCTYEGNLLDHPADFPAWLVEQYASLCGGPVYPPAPEAPAAVWEEVDKNSVEYVRADGAVLARVEMFAGRAHVFLTTPAPDDFLPRWRTLDGAKAEVERVVRAKGLIS